MNMMHTIILYSYLLSACLNVQAARCLLVSPFQGLEMGIVVWRSFSPPGPFSSSGCCSPFWGQFWSPLKWVYHVVVREHNICIPSLKTWVKAETTLLIPPVIRSFLPNQSCSHTHTHAPQFGVRVLKTHWHRYHKASTLQLWLQHTNSKTRHKHSNQCSSPS